MARIGEREKTIFVFTHIWVSHVSARCCHPIASNWFCDWINMYICRDSFTLTIDYDTWRRQMLCRLLLLVFGCCFLPQFAYLPVMINHVCLRVELQNKAAEKTPNTHISLLITYALCTIYHLVECVWRCSSIFPYCCLFICCELVVPIFSHNNSNNNNNKYT